MPRMGKKQMNKFFSLLSSEVICHSSQTYANKFEL